MPPKSISDIGPPITMPTVPAATMNRATGPSLATLPRSTDTISISSAKRRRYGTVQS